MEQLTLEALATSAHDFCMQESGKYKRNYMGLPTGKPWVHLLSINFRNF